MNRSRRLQGSLCRYSPLELEVNEEEYCDDGNCGACPGCRFAEGDEKYHRRIDEELERMTDAEWEKMKEGK
jgi:hypothetical protein